MNAELKKKWVEGLRSEKYEQVTGHLFDGTYEDAGGRTIVRCCALGVLNDVSGLGYWRVDGYVVETPEHFSADSWEEQVHDRADAEDYSEFIDGWRWGDPQVSRPNLDDYPSRYPDPVVETIRYCFFAEVELAHPEVVKVAELAGQSPEIMFEGRLQRLNDLNDKGVPFDVLAELIEEQL